MGRHRADSAGSRDADVDGGVNEEGDVTAPLPVRDPAGAANDLLGWGMFLAATAAAAMVWAGIDWPITAGCALLLLLSFAAVWRVQRGSGRGLPAVAAAPAAPAPSARPEPAAVSAPAVPTGPTGSTGSTADAPTPAEPAPITRRQMRAADPSTGLLPIIQAGARPVPQAPERVLTGLNPIVPGGRRERRHTATTSTPTAAAATTPPAAAATGEAAATAGASRAAGESNSAGAGDPAGESRWTRTFGPPETGQLPVQRYIAGAAAGGPADPDQPDRRQRSHSSL